MAIFLSPLTLAEKINPTLYGSHTGTPLTLEDKSLIFMKHLKGPVDLECAMCLKFVRPSAKSLGFKFVWPAINHWHR